MVVFFTSCQSDDHKRENNIPKTLVVNPVLFKTLLKSDNITTDKVPYDYINHRFIKHYEEVFYEKSNVILDTIDLGLGFITEGQFDDLSSRDSLDDFALTFFSENIQDEPVINGFLLHTIFDSNLKVILYRKDDLGNFITSEDLSWNTSDYKLNQILYLADKYFPLNDIHGYSVESFASIIEETFVDDLELQMLAEFRVKKEEIASKSSNILKTDAFISIDDRPGDACGYATNCWSGSGSCHPFGGGCRPLGTCRKNEIEEAYDDYNLLSSKQLFMNNISDVLAYSLRDKLEATPKGQYYIDLYYASSNEIFQNLDADLLLSLAQNSSDINDLIVSYISNDSDFIVTENQTSAIINVLNEISENSTSLNLIRNIDLVKSDVQNSLGKSNLQIEQSLQW